MTVPADLAALFMLGFLGTGHCIGMCGPLVVALPGQTGRFAAHLAYHAGRLLAYGVIGGLMGAVGSGLIHLAGMTGGDPLVWMGRVRVGLGLLAACLLLVFGLSRVGLIGEPDWMSVAAPSRMPGWRRIASRPAARRSDRELFLMGLLLGGIPCGLSYAAFAQALSVAQPWAGGTMALVFGVGTLPGMLAVGAGGAMVLNRFRRQADLLAGLIMIAMAARLLVSTLAGLMA